MNVRALKGFKDILPGEVETWQWLEGKARDVFHRFGFSEIRVPILEQTELFVRSIGEETDIVAKEMYTFTDRNGDSVTMRPEGTASVLRAFIENGLHVAQPLTRLFTIGPMFRHERPQKGRLRQFHQMSVEAVGSHSALVDTEVMAMAWTLLTELDVPVSLQINSLGCADCRQVFKKELAGFLDGLGDKLCPDCQRRRTTNPLRVLDCKSEHCKQQYLGAPQILDYLCPSCHTHFTAVRKGLDLLQIPYTVNAFMVRGLDYYTKTTFEFLTDALGAQSAVGAGGRYDGLVKQLGGQDLPGIGFAIGVERLALLVSQKDRTIKTTQGPDLYLAVLNDEAREKVLPLVQGLRTAGISVAIDLEGRSLKSQMKQSNRLSARHVYIIGPEELANGAAWLRDMASGAQESVPLTSDTTQWCLQLIDKIRA